jgi:hypothetical protein
MVKGVYLAERDWLACEKCHAAIQADDCEARVDPLAAGEVAPDGYSNEAIVREGLPHLMRHAAPKANSAEAGVTSSANGHPHFGVIGADFAARLR